MDDLDAGFAGGLDDVGFWVKVEGEGVPCRCSCCCGRSWSCSGDGTSLSAGSSLVCTLVLGAPRSEKLVPSSCFAGAALVGLLG